MRSKKIAFCIIPILVVCMTIALFSICAGSVEAEDELFGNSEQLELVGNSDELGKFGNAEYYDELPAVQIEINTPYQHEAWYLAYVLEDQGYIRSLEEDFDKFNLAFSVSRLESANFSHVSVNHNWGGLSNASEQPYSYVDDYEGIQAFVDVLLKYSDRDTPEKLGEVWCPAHYDEWVAKVKTIMKETTVSIN